MDQIIKILAERLEGKGIEAAKIPSCIETILNLSFFYPIPSCRDLNSRMRSFGWINFEIDDHTFKLVKLISDKPELRAAPRYPEFKQAWFKRRQSSKNIKNHF